MSKKKGNGHTMTLKDFHGGSIPPDLPLPSAPGLTVKTSDRSGYERPSSRGNPIDRSDHRSLPNNSSLSWHFDDKTPFLTQTGPVGTNFDEDERKPLDGTSAPRGTINGEGIWGPPSRVELKSASGLGGNSLGPKVASGSQYHVGKRNSYSATLTEVSRVGMDSQNLKGSRAEGTNFASPNVWTMRKDVASLVKSDQSAWSGSNAFSKLAHASAIDKVSSGRWQSEKVHCQMNFEISKSSEVESRSLRVNGNSTHNRIDTVDEKRYSDVMKARQAERCRNELLEHERCEISKYSEVRSRHHHTNGAQPVLNDAKLCGPELQHSLASEPRERPKLNSSRRTKPLDSEPSVADNNVQLRRQGSDSSHVETVNKPHDHANIVNPDSARTESREEERQRPKLNVKLWSQSLEKLEGNTRSDRNALFGGARPRELVLKERGVDDAAINNYGEVEEKNRAKKLSDRSVQTHYLEKTEDAHQPYARKPERSDRWVDDERKQRRNWHGDNRISMTASDRKPSPEMWQKPAEQKKSSDAVDLQCVKAASAVELVQAFSRSTSDPKVNDRLPGHRGDTGRAQQPFSRLVGPAPKPSSND